jgi:hypothetical protein
LWARKKKAGARRICVKLKLFGKAISTFSLLRESSSSASLRTWHLTLARDFLGVSRNQTENYDSKHRFGVREKCVWSMWIGEALGFCRFGVKMCLEWTAGMCGMLGRLGLRESIILVSFVLRHPRIFNLEMYSFTCSNFFFLVLFLKL